jgi:hypothetical protein
MLAVFFPKIQLVGRRLHTSRHGNNGLRERCALPLKPIEIAPDKAELTTIILTCGADVVKKSKILSDFK